MDELLQCQSIPGFEEYVDIDAALARIRGNKKLYLRMLGMFQASTEFAAFEDAMAKGDYPQAGEIAHGIKGMTGNLALNKVFDLSAQLMTQLRSGIADEALLAQYRDALVKTNDYVALVCEQMEA